jgi:hypothetical protein
MLGVTLAFAKQNFGCKTLGETPAKTEVTRDPDCNESHNFNNRSAVADEGESKAKEKLKSGKGGGPSRVTSASPESTKLLPKARSVAELPKKREIQRRHLRIKRRGISSPAGGDSGRFGSRGF